MTNTSSFRIPPVEFETRVKTILSRTICLLVAATPCLGPWTGKTTQRLLGARGPSLRDFVADWVCFWHIGLGYLSKFGLTDGVTL